MLSTMSASEVSEENGAVEDEEICSLLTSINCREHIKIFQEHQLDFEACLLLSDEEIKELFPKIGQRLQFKKKFEVLKSRLYVDTYNVETKNQHTVNNEDTKCVDTYNGKETETQSQQKILRIDDTVNNENNAESLDGRAILREGQKGGILKESSRRKLSQLVVGHILEKNPIKQIDSKEFSDLSKDICQIFKKESAVVYYSAYSAASVDGGRKKNSSGKLYESYINRRRKLRESGDLQKPNRSASSSSSVSSASSISLEHSENANEEYISWLKNNVEPWETVQKHWKETENIRLNKIKAGEGKIEDYFNDFPALKQPQGYTLLLQDFDRLFPGKENNLFSQILLKQEDILKYAKAKLKLSRDKYVTSRLRELLSLVDDTNPESSVNVALMVLPLVINLSPTRRHKTPAWKPSRAEIAQGFIAQAASEGEVTEIIIEKKEKLRKLGRTVQPYVVVVGSSEDQVRKAYVVINDTLYSFQKLITAVDAAFKTFQATGAYYPEESEDIWTTIQIGFYGISTRYDRKTQAVNVILADLELID